MVWQLPPISARRLGSIDNWKKTERGQEAIDMIHMGEGSLDRMTFGYLKDHVELNASLMDLARGIELPHLREHGMYLDAELGDGDYPVIDLIADELIFDRHNQAIFKPLENSINRSDIRDTIYADILQSEAHLGMRDIDKNKRIKKNWTNALDIAIQSPVACDLLREIDELLREQQITVTSVEAVKAPAPKAEKKRRKTNAGGYTQAEISEKFASQSVTAQANLESKVRVGLSPVHFYHMHCEDTPELDRLLAAVRDRQITVKEVFGESSANKPNLLDNAHNYYIFKKTVLANFSNLNLQDTSGNLITSLNDQSLSALSKENETAIEIWR